MTSPARRRSVVIAPDSFKGSIGAPAAADVIAAGWLSQSPHDDVLVLPLADGGEGTLQVLYQANPAAEWHEAGIVSGADGRLVRARWLELPTGSRVVELASTCGIEMLTNLDPMGASTRGLGQVLRLAALAGDGPLFVAVGGSASTDGGAGALTALGFSFLDRAGRPISEGGGALASLETLSADNAVPPPDEVIVLTDVDTPLVGPRGAAAVFGPQKGADARQVALLDASLSHYAAILGGDPTAPGSGAAGGTAYGLSTLWGARLTSGFEWISQQVGLPDALRYADVVVTGEGCLDRQSVMGKVVGRVADVAARHSVQLLAIAGQVTFHPPYPTISLEDIAGSKSAAMSDPARWLFAAAARSASHFPR